MNIEKKKKIITRIVEKRNRVISKHKGLIGSLKNGAYASFMEWFLEPFPVK